MGDNMKSKQGISLIVLIVTIIVMLILLSIIIVSVNNVSGNSKLAAFATDLSKKEEDMVMNQGVLLSRVGEENKEKFIAEL